MVLVYEKGVLPVDCRQDFVSGSLEDPCGTPSETPVRSILRHKDPLAIRPSACMTLLFTDPGPRVIQKIIVHMVDHAVGT